jgi:hypothetical protein
LRFLFLPALVIDQLHHFIDWSASHATCSRKQVSPLPDSACASTLRAVITIPHRNNAKERRGA